MPCSIHSFRYYYTTLVSLVGAYDHGLYSWCFLKNKQPCRQCNCMAFVRSIDLVEIFPMANTILRGFFMLWRRNFLYWNRRWHFAFSASKEDLNGRFFVFKRNESRFEEKFPNTALFYCEKLSQSFRRFLVRYAEPVESHYSRLVRHFCFPLYIYKGKRDDADEENHIQCSAQSQGS